MFAAQLLAKWNPCGLNKSLQQILSEAEEEEQEKCPADEKLGLEEGCSFCKDPCLKSPASELFLFLKEIV